MMKAILFLAVSLAAAAKATTTVAVVELGKGGTVRRTTSKSASTTLSGVASFWSSLHGGRHLSSHAHAGQTVVPDLFRKADGGLVLGLSGKGLDLATMPNLSAMVQHEGSNHVIGHLELDGAFARPLLSKVGIAEEATTANLKASAAKKLSQRELSAMRMTVDENNADAVDSEVASLVESLHRQALAEGRTVVLHVVVEEEEGSARRRLVSRRLEEEGQEEGEGEEDQGDQDEEAEGEEAEGNAKNGYYGVGYYNSYGEWVTPYKTMFQIQYFNVVLWTSLGLAAVIFFSIYLVMYMPLMADTLLFGESAKMMGS